MKYYKKHFKLKNYFCVLGLIGCLCALSGCSWYDFENGIKGSFKNEENKSEISDEEYISIESEIMQEIKEKNEDMNSIEGSSEGLHYKIMSSGLYDNIKDAGIKSDDIYLDHDIAADGSFKYSYDGNAQKLLECEVRVTNEDGSPIVNSGEKYFLLDLRFNSEATEEEGFFSVEKIYIQPHGDSEKDYNRFWIEPGESVDFKVGFIIKEKWLEKECHLVVNVDTFQGIILDIPDMNGEKRE